MHVPECNHKVTGNGYKAVVGCEAETSTKALVKCSRVVHGPGGPRAGPGPGLEFYFYKQARPGRAG